MQCLWFGKRKSSYVAPTPPPSLLLDQYPGATVAYSLRKLRNAYTGPAVLVRRASDNTDKDIGFLGNDFDVVSLLLFCGLSAGYVVKWYDQSGNGNHLVQPSATNQPMICNGGVVVTENGKPAIDFDNTANHFFNILTAVSSANNWTQFHVTRRRASGQIGIMGLAGTSYGAWIFSDNNIYARNRNGFEQASLNVATQQILTTTATLNDVSIRNNRAVISTTFTPLASSDDFVYFNRRASDTGNGKSQELIHYPDDKSADTVAIETNQNSYYGAF